MLKIIISLLFSTLLLASNCAECHEKVVENYKHNIHYTLKKAINITRKAWGVKDSNVTFQTLPKAKIKIKKVSDLVDDFLRRKCLKCHMDSKVNNGYGITRSIGCLSCHSKHQSSGKCQRSKISINKCLSCHNKNYVGGDYLGLFPKDEDRSYRAPLTKEGNFPPVKYGIDYHHLEEDIHYKKGLSCVDCHNAKDMHGGRKAKCIDCHKNLSKKNHTSYHKNISCSACHSTWNNNSYELSVFRDDTASYKKWKNLTMQEDEYLSIFLNKALKSKKKIKPQMPDWVSGGLKKGIWYSGWRYKRWEFFNLANSDDGTIKIIRPLYQYRVSYRDAKGTMVFDDVSKINGKKMDVWIPYSPHTIGKRAKSCESCHLNPLIINPYKGNNEILNLKNPTNIVNGSPLSPEQIEKMKSEKYKKIRAKMLFSK